MCAKGKGDSHRWLFCRYIISCPQCCNPGSASFSEFYYLWALAPLLVHYDSDMSLYELQVELL